MEMSIEPGEIDADTTCAICYAEFLDNDDLNVHMTQHVGLNLSYKHFCSSCNKVFPDIEYYAQHIIEDHLITAVCCQYCSRVFYDAKLLKTHEIKHNASSLTTRLSCSQCMSYFYNTTDLQAHEFKEHNDSKDGIMIQSCFSMISSLLNMNIRRFFDAHHENITYKCVYCKLCTPDVSFYLCHLREENVKSFSCDNCCDVFPNKIMLRQHYTHRKNLCKNYVRKNNPEKQCKKCQLKFLPTSYQRHVKLCAGMRCIPCNINFESFSDYSEHLKYHKNAIPLSTCKFCYRQFVGQISLDKHIERAHKDSFHLYKYKCVECDQLFMHPKLLFTHYFTKHKTMEPYTCKICDVRFRVRKKFTLHIKLQHKSIGFVEFDENYFVFFTDKKSEKPFIPQCQIPTELNQTEHLIQKKSIRTGKIKQTESNEKSKLSDHNKNIKDTIDITVEENMDSNLINSEHDIDMASSLAPAKNKSADDGDNGVGYETNQSDVDFNFMNPTETEGDHTEAESKLLKSRKRKTKIGKPRKRTKIENMDISSDDSDVPLVAVKSKAKLHQNLSGPRLKRSKEKFICKKCNKNCYTYQNYHHHLSLHAKDKNKQCIKCDETFRSKSALTEHIEKNHSSSKLTETLKQLLERRKNNVLKPKDRNSIAEGLRKTIKKVLFEKSNGSITLTPVDDKISVKNFFENFTPDTSDASTKNTQTGITIQEFKGGDAPSPTIKMTKFSPEPIHLNTRPKMPVKFKDFPNSQIYKVSFKISTISQSKPILRFSQKLEDTDHSYADNFSKNNYQSDQPYADHFEAESDHIDEKDDVIPEVAEEIMLNTEPVKQDVITIDSIPEQYADLKIGHLQEQAPFYKIVKITEVINPTESKKQEKVDVPKKIVLPDGTKLVNVNPLAHLMGETNMQEIFKPKKKRYYEPKPRDIKTAIAKALDQQKNVRKKKL